MPLNPVKSTHEGNWLHFSLKYGSTLPSPEGDEQRVESIIKDVEFREKFLQKYNSTMCRELMGADFATKEGAQKIKEEQKMITFCPQLVADIIDVLEEIIHI